MTTAAPSTALATIQDAVSRPVGSTALVDAAISA